MATKKEKKVREKIDLDHDTLMDLWDNVNYKGDSHELNGEKYTHVDKINTSDKSDGDSWDYIVQRKSDGKHFKFNVWDAGSHNGYVFEDKFLEEVFPKTVTTTKYK
jgi:hypothetical protein